MVLALLPAVQMRAQRRGQTVCIVRGQRTLRVRALTPGIRRALRMLAKRGAAESALSDVVLQVDGAAALPRWYYCLETLQSFGAVCGVLRQQARTIVRLTPVARSFRITCPVVVDDKPYELSRFAYLRRERKWWVLESPLSSARLELADRRAVVLLATLSRPTTLGELAAAVPGTGVEMARMVLSLLSGARMLADADPATRDWDFASLIFHARSRGGPGYGGAPATQRARWRPPAAIKPAMSTTMIPLSRPDLEALQARDAPFTRVLEARRSLRSYDAVPLAARQLGEFLFRAARVTRLTRARVAGALMRFTLRPYPSGGACYGLELYVVVGNCGKLARGLYHYDPLHHRLEVLAASGADLDRLLRRASATAGRSAAPQVLIVITARFRRVAWKYRSVAYSLILKEVGALMQTMYLVATAMRLAPCALGGGDPELVARLIGSDFAEETSVGEFLLGSR